MKLGELAVVDKAGGSHANAKEAIQSSLYNEKASRYEKQDDTKGGLMSAVRTTLTSFFKRIQTECCDGWGFRRSLRCWQDARL